MPSRRRPLVALVALVAIAAAVVAFLAFDPPGPPRAARRPGASASTAPDAALSPEQVVAAVLAALKNNDPDRDDGIATTFHFASPANQAMTGPVERFAAMVKQPPYLALVNHRSARVKPLFVDDARAIDLVRIVARDGQRTYYRWDLSKQSADGPLKGCWLTDAVRPVPPPPGEDDPEERI